MTVNKSTCSMVRSSPKIARGMQGIPLRSGGRRLLLLPLQLLGVDDRRDAGLATRAVIFGCEVLRTHENFTRNLTLLWFFS